MSRIVNLFFIIIVCKHIYTYKYIFMNKKKIHNFNHNKTFSYRNKERERASKICAKKNYKLYILSFIHLFICLVAYNMLILFAYNYLSLKSGNVKIPFYFQNIYIVCIFFLFLSLHD